MLAHPSTSRTKLPTLLSRKEQETFCLGQCTLALQGLHFGKVSCCLSGNSCREAPGSISSFATRTRAQCKPGPHGHPAVGKTTALVGSGEANNVLPPPSSPLYSLCGTRWNPFVHKRCWTVLARSASYRGSETFSCFHVSFCRGSLEGKKGLRLAEGAAHPELPTLQGRPCPSRGAAKVVRVSLCLDVSGIWVSLHALSRKQSCVEEGTEQHPGSGSSGSW